MDVLRWQTHLHPVWAAAMILVLAAWLIVLFKRQRPGRSWPQTLLLFLPKVLIALLVVLAYFDPIRTVTQQPKRDKKIMVLIDHSSSMDCVDEPGRSRRQRADQLSQDLTHELNTYVDFDTRDFDAAVHDKEPTAASDEPIRGTNLATSLVAASQTVNGANYLATVLLTDGGDELIQNPRLPKVPLYIASQGSAPETWDDLAVKAVVAPAVADVGSTLDVSADVLAHVASREFETNLATVRVRLEEKTGDTWNLCDTEYVRFDHPSQRVTFSMKAPSESGTKTYRVRLETIDGELSGLNNTREFSVDVREDTLHVLFFTQDLGWDFSTIRRELVANPSVKLTALFRVTEARFIVQGSRQPGDEQLTAGFPTSKAVLDLFQCVIVGSFGAAQWQQDQYQAVVDYVRHGGAVVFLGGEESFSLGGYIGTPVEPLFPWRLSPAQSAFQLGQFSVKVPPSALDDSIMRDAAGLMSQVDSVWVDSVNVEGPLKPGARTLLEVRVAGRTVPLIAVQRFGQGQTMAIATNTLWKWHRLSPALQEAYGHFWRETVTHMTDWEESQRFISVQWDQQHYDPGEQARAQIRVAGHHEPGQLHLKATRQVEEKSSPVSVEPLVGSENTFTAKVDFTERADYTFELQAFIDNQALETYRKTFMVGSRLNEGANLEVDHAFLRSLCARGGGMYFPETESKSLIETLKGQLIRRIVSQEMPLIQDKGMYVFLFIGVLVMEWIIRRKMNLL